MAAKPIKYSEKIAVSLSPEHMQALKDIANETGDTVSGILRRLAVQFISERKKK